ncbi:MAG: hypothetical protein H6706_27460 [Myxococcales bacterium]|nr:hypothetical protein [Myxococcales bacterium]
MAVPDQGPAGPIACAARDACAADHLCVAGRCAAYVEVEEGAEGFVQVEELVAGCDADGTVRLLTQLEPEVDRRFGHLIVGRPGAWEVSAPLGMAWRNSTQLTNGTRQAGQTAHLSFLAHAYRGVIVDGRGTVTEDRVITRHDHAFTPAGDLWLLTQPQIPGGIDDRFPLRLWRPVDGRWEVDEVERDVGFGVHHHLRFDAQGRPEILRLAGGVGGLVRRYRQGVAGWETENIWRENLGGNSMAGAAINGPDGKTHILLGNIDAERLTLVYLQVGDAGVERQVVALDAAFRFTYVPESLQFDDDGNLYFLAHGPASPQSQRPTEVRRIDPQGDVTAGIVDYIDFDAFGADRQALAVAPDGDFYLFTARRDRRMRIRTWRLAR